MRGRGAGVIGVVAIHQHIKIRFDVGEHAAHDIALALAMFAAHDGAGFARPRHGLVAGIVVIDIDRRVRQRGAEIAHDLGDRGFFIVAGHQDGDAWAHGFPVKGHH